MRFFGSLELVFLVGIVAVGVAQFPGDDGPVPCVYEQKIGYATSVVYDSTNPSCDREIPKIILKYEDMLLMKIWAASEKNQSLQVNINDVCNFDVQVEGKGLKQPATLRIGDLTGSPLEFYVKDTFIASKWNSTESVACAKTSIQTGADEAGWKQAKVLVIPEDATITVEMMSMKANKVGRIHFLRTETYSPPSTSSATNFLASQNAICSLIATLGYLFFFVA